MRSGAGEMTWGAWGARISVPRVCAGEPDRARVRRSAPAGREYEVRADESALIQRCLANDQQAFRELIRRY